MDKNLTPSNGKNLDIKSEFTKIVDINTQYTAEQKAFIKSTLAPTLNDTEILHFIYRAQRLGLNPLDSEIFAYASFETVAGNRVRKMIVIVGKNGKLRKAFESGHLRRIETKPVYVLKLKEGGYKKCEWYEGGELVGAECNIWRDDMDAPFTVSAKLSEYKRPNGIWIQKTETMIKKVAESQCLSLAFPELAGVYDESERFDDTPVVQNQVLPVEGGSNPASESQLKTIQALGGEVTENMTKEEAIQKIRELGMKGKHGK